MAPRDDPNFKAFRQQLDVQSTIQNWNHRHRPALNWATFNAFDLKNHPERGQTHAFLVTLEETGSKKIRSKFRVVEASLISMADLKTSRPQDMEMIENGDREANLRGTQDRVSTHNLIALGEFSLWSGSFWDHQELEEYTLDADWKQILRSVTDGKDEYTIVNGAAVRQTDL